MNGDRSIEKNQKYHFLFNKKGITFLGVLAFMVVSGIALTAASRYWSTVIRREKEEELLFRGDQIRSAIASYYDSAPKGRKPSYPKNLEDLLKDPRYLNLRRHLRKIYKDPVTKDGTWGLIKSKGGITGVFSRSQLKPIKGANFPEVYKDFEKAKNYSDWRFVHTIKKAKKKTS